MAYIIAEPCIGTKDTACVDACPVDCIHPKKDTQYEVADQASMRWTNSSSTRLNASTAAPAFRSAPFRRSSRGDLPEKWQSYIEKNANYVTSGKFQADTYKAA